MRYSLNRFLWEQLDATRDAMLPLAVAVLLTALLVWLLTRWSYRRTLAQIDEAHSAYSDQTIIASDGVEDTVYLAPRTKAGSDEESRAQRKALRAITHALDSANAVGSADDVDRALPIMKLAMTLTRSAFHLPIPAYGGNASTNFVASRQWLELVRPALRAGNVEEARRRSTAYLANDLRSG